jgi:hypothetical protein
LLAEVAKSFRDQVDEYFGDNLYDHSFYRVAEYLDPRTAWSIESKEALDDVQSEIKMSDLVFISERSRPSQSNSSNKKSNAIFTKSNSNSSKSLFALECEKYQDILLDLGEDKCMEYDPLVFWPKYAEQLPIHARIAAKVLAAPATSADVERLFSLAGRILCKMRARLTPAHVNELTCLNKWISGGKFERDTTLNMKRAKRNERFTTLSLKLELVAGEDTDEDESDDEDA